MRADVTICKINNSFGYILCDDTSIVKDIWENLSFWVPGFQFMPKYKSGQFDGKIKLMDLATRRFPLGLSHHIYEFCKNNKISCDIENAVIDSFYDRYVIREDILGFLENIKLFSKGEMITPREDQLEAVIRAITKKRVVNICPTSFGKSLSITLQCIWFTKKLYKRCLIVVPTKDLVEQFYNDIKDYATNDLNELEDWYPNVQMMYSGKDKELYDDTEICISTWQTLARLDEGFINQFDAVILDECFHEDSMVLTPNGYRKIKDIKVGDKVINYSEKYNDFKVDEVVEVHKNLTSSMSEKMYKLEFDNKKIIKVTGNHKFLTSSGWKRADELIEDDEIISCISNQFNKCIKIYNRIIRRTEIEKPNTVYNLHVKDDHNYIVEGAVVHNCHKGQAPVIQNIMEKAIHVEYRTGWTGTLSNTTIGELQIKGIFGPVKEITTTKKLMDDGIVAKLFVAIVRLKYPQEESLGILKLSYNAQMKYLEKHKARTNKLMEIVQTQPKTGLMLYRLINYGEELYKVAKKNFPDRNIYLIHGNFFMRNDVKYKNMEELKALIEEDDSGIIIANYQVVGTGISIKNLNWLMFASPVKSFIATMQGIGRILRVSKVKNKAVLIDIVDDFCIKKRTKISENYAVRHFHERFMRYNDNKFNYKLITFPIGETRKETSIEEY